MRCAISSRAGQILARGRLVVRSEEDGLRLYFMSDRGTTIEGGLADADGDLTSAGEVLFAKLFETWGMTDLTLTAIATSAEEKQKLLRAKDEIELL
ncbi:MAG: hypothetical protein ACFB4I_06630 [Cyanophyceae cyanobacterium]